MRNYVQIGASVPIM